MQLVLLLVFSATAAFGQEQQLQQSDTDPKTFFASCHNRKHHNVTCASYHCFSLHHQLDLRQLDQMPCRSKRDCGQDETGFACVKYSAGRSFCECPKHHAYNATACRCQRAEHCVRSNNQSSNKFNNGGGVACHNGMRCLDTQCSCGDLTRTLFEPMGRICVAPSADDYEYADEEEGSDHQRAFWIVLCVIGAFLSLAVLAIAVYVCTENITCDRGRYECDDEKEEENNHHIAAWNMPGMDYLSEEQTLKYIREHETGRQLNRSVQQQGSSHSSNSSDSSLQSHTDMGGVVAAMRMRRDDMEDRSYDQLNGSTMGGRSQSRQDQYLESERGSSVNLPNGGSGDSKQESGDGSSRNESRQQEHDNEAYEHDGSHERPEVMSRTSECHDL